MRRVRQLGGVRSVVGAIVLFGLLGSAAHATSMKHQSCGPRSAHTLLGSKTLRLYRSGSTASKTVLYVCSKDSDRRRKLGPVRPDKNVWSASIYDPFALAGNWAGAIESRLRGQDSVRVYSASRNVVTGDGRHCYLGGADRPGQLPKVLETFLTPNGSLAWVAVLPIESDETQIGVCEAAGRRILDSGDGIETNSVVLTGTTLTWTDSDMGRSAALR